MTSPTLPSPLDPFIAMIREKLERASEGNAYDVAFPSMFVKKLADVMTDARNALARQSGQASASEGQVFHGVMLPSHERIRAKYLDNVNPPTALERLVFDTTVDAPGQGEALRALLEGGPAVPVVTP